MFIEGKLIEAVRIQKLSYGLLLWIADQIDSGRFTFSKIHTNENPSDVMLDWLNTYYDYLPKHLLPKREKLKSFSNYFSSYLTTSFEMVESPDKILRSNNGCLCDLCLQLVNASHLKRKKPKKIDKEDAKIKRFQIIKELGLEEGLDLPDSIYKKINHSKEFLRDTAYLAYAKSLIERIDSSKGGIYILVLWRQFAWKPEGSPIKEFKLNVEYILNAELNLKKKLNEEYRKMINNN